MGAKLQGYEKLLYIGTKGSTASTQIVNATDVDDKYGTELGSTTVRGASGVPKAASRVCQLNAEISWKMLYDESDTNLQTLLAAAAAGTAVAVRTKSSSTGKGFDGDCVLSAVSVPGPLTGEIVVEFTGTPNNDERAWLQNV